jgi:hypothetical protein
MSSNSSRDTYRRRPSQSAIALRNSGCRLQLELQIALEHFAHVLADQQLAQVLQVRQSLQEQDPLDELDPRASSRRAIPCRCTRRARRAPVVVHAGVEEVLVDRRQLVLEDRVEVDAGRSGYLAWLETPAARRAAILASALETGNRNRQYRGLFGANRRSGGRVRPRPGLQPTRYRSR